MVVRACILTSMLLLAGCLDSAPDDGQEPEGGMAEVTIASGTFHVSPGVLPFVVELTESVEASLEADGGQLGPFQMPAAGAVLTEEDWQTRGACRTFEPVLSAQTDDEIATASLQPGRYVVVQLVSFSGQLTVSFGGGPEQEAPQSGSASSSGSFSESSSMLGTDGTAEQRSPDGDELTYTYLGAEPNGPELEVTHRLEVDGGECGVAQTQTPDVARHVSLWFWASAPYMIAAEADAAPVPPESTAGTFESRWTFS